MYISVENTSLRYCEQGTDGPLIIWPMFYHEGNEFEHMWECLVESVKDKSFCLVALEIKDWNSQLSPWKAPAQMMDEEFEGKGKETLSFITERCIPVLKERFGNRKVIIAGYSLAGLFALWASYENESFDATCCCSGSLWIDGWDSYMDSQNFTHKCKVYLSLGGKEELSKNKRVAIVGERTRKQIELLRKDPNVTLVRLDMNHGGHFADSAKRIAKGVRWILN